MKKFFEIIYIIVSEIITIILELKYYILVLVLVGLFLDYYGIERSLVTGESMRPTLQDEQIIFIGDYFGDNIPQINDIIVFEHEEKVMIKRVVGVAGDTIHFENGDLFRNGVRIEEDYIFENQCIHITDEVFVVPEGEVFVLGDNRNVSKDSRLYADPYVDIDDIVGKWIKSIWDLF